MQNELTPKSPQSKKTQARHTRRTQAQWAKLIDQWERSELTQKAFCESEGLCYRNFSQWKSRLKKNAKPNPSLVSKLSHCEFIPVRFDEHAQCSSRTPSKVEIHLPGQIQLLLDADLNSVLTLIKGITQTSC